MNTKTKILIGLTAIALIFLWARMVGGSVSQETPTIVVPEEKPLVTHAQGVWISALEWCESRGVKTLVNKVDRDGTASYYSFQFKSGTFRNYGEIYGVIEKGLSQEIIMTKMKDHALQKKIVEHMVADQKNIKWEQQFPDCVKKKIGRPPAY